MPGAKQEDASLGDRVYDAGCAAARYAKPVLHVAWIPFLIWLGMNEEPYPGLLQVIMPPA